MGFLKNRSTIEKKFSENENKICLIDQTESFLQSWRPVLQNLSQMCNLKYTVGLVKFRYLTSIRIDIKEHLNKTLLVTRV